MLAWTHLRPLFIGVELRRLDGVGLTPLNRTKPSVACENARHRGLFDGKCQLSLTCLTHWSIIIARQTNGRSLHEEAHVLGICRNRMHGHVCLDGQSPPLRVLSAGGFRELEKPPFRRSPR